MAAAEARALWQRTANRCFVQEDAKRAPKLACATSKLVDTGPANTVDESDFAATIVTNFNRKTSFSSSAPASDPRWWLHQQPNYGYQKGLTKEQLIALEVEVENLIGIDENKTSSENSLAFPDLMDVMKKHEKMEIDSIGCSMLSKRTADFSLESDYSWIESDKTEPWWRTSDRDELASFVSQKSLNHIENCDLPPPKKKHLRGHSTIGDDKIQTASCSWGAESRSFSNSTPLSQGCLDSRLVPKKLGPYADDGLLYFASDKSSSHASVHGDVAKSQQISEGGAGKAQLMEALCHSQTRAREAEEAAKQAYAEKEDIVTLIFKQASQLFAYKQWFKLLQLESLCNQIKNNNQPTSTLFPVALPWMSYQGWKARSRKRKKQAFSTGRQEREGKPKCDVTTYAVAIALGLSLVGAGLLLGWTVGWMLPRS